MFKFGHALSISFALHAVLGGLLLISMSFQLPPEFVDFQQPNFSPIEAVVVDQKMVDDQLKRIEQQKQAQLQKERDEQRRKEQEVARQQELEAKRQQQIEDKKRREQAAAQAREEKRKAEEKARQQEAQRQQKELERRAAQERERKAQQEKERIERARQEKLQKEREERERKEMERLMQEQLKAEQAQQAVRSQQRQRQVLTETEKYKALIRGTIMQNLNEDDSMNGKSCRVNFRLSSTGFIIQVRVLGGDKQVCIAAERAILRAQEVPMSSDLEVYEQLKDVTIKFDL